MKRKDVPKDFWNYRINPITGLIIPGKGTTNVTEEDVRTRRFSPPGYTQ